jgi:hypothetical protein
MNARILAILSLALLSAAHADEMAQQKRASVFAKLPNWNGIWETEAWTQRTAAGRPAGGMAEVRAKSVMMGHPPYKPDWDKRYQAGKAATAASEVGRKVCSFGFPQNMESPALFQVAITPEETLFVFATPDVRHIYTDGRPHTEPDLLWLTRMGDSIGHWEGDTLVIDTIARAAEAPIAIASPGLNVSEQARFVERVRLVSPDRLEDQLTIIDPVALTKPYTVTIHYRRAQDMQRLIHHDCFENDRNPVVDGKLTIAPSK